MESCFIHHVFVSNAHANRCGSGPRARCLPPPAACIAAGNIRNRMSQNKYWLSCSWNSKICTAVITTQVSRTRKNEGRASVVILLQFRVSAPDHFYPVWQKLIIPLAFLQVKGSLEKCDGQLLQTKLSPHFFWSKWPPWCFMVHSHHCGRQIAQPSKLGWPMLRLFI